MPNGESYRIRGFAELAGVTIRALHYYDRTGLLTPVRTAAGYRVYFPKDLERLQQIMALRFLGMPLRRIRQVLERAPLELAEALRLQRKSIEDKQAGLDRELRAIRAAEDAIQPGILPDPAILRKIIEVIKMPESVSFMKKYYSEAAWEQRRNYYENGPSPEWLDLWRDANALLNEDPAGPAAQALADRWLRLSIRAFSGDPAVQTDSQGAWQDRANWPPAMKQRLAELNVEQVRAFVEKAALFSRRKYFTEGAWSRFCAKLRPANADPGRREPISGKRV